MKRRITKNEWFDVDLYTELSKHDELKSRIDKLNLDKKRDSIINLILKKNN